MPFHGVKHGVVHGAVHGGRHGIGPPFSTGGNGVVQDGPANWYVPQSTADYTTLGITPPNSGLWLCQDAAGPAILADQLGLLNLAQAGTVPTYQQTVANWARLGVAMVDGSSTRMSVGVGVGPNPALVSTAWLWYMDITASGGTRQNFFATGTGGGSAFVRTTVTPRMQLTTSFGTQTGPTVDPVAAGVVACLLVINQTALTVKLYTSLELFTGTYGVFLDGTKGVGGSGGAHAGQTVIYGAHWSGAAAEAVDTKTTLTALNISIPY